MTTLQSAVSSQTRGAKAPAQFHIHDEKELDEASSVRCRSDSLATKRSNEAVGDGTIPLTTSKLLNQQAQPCIRSEVSKQKTNHTQAQSPVKLQQAKVEQLLTRLSEQQQLIQKQKQALTSKDRSNNPLHSHDGGSSYGSVTITPAANTFAENHVPPTTNSEHPQPVDAVEFLRLKQELLIAKNRIAKMDQELSQTRITKHTLEQAMGSSLDVDVQLKGEGTEYTLNKLRSAFNASTKPSGGTHNMWTFPDDSHSDASESLSAELHNNAQKAWANPHKNACVFAISPTSEARHANPLLKWSQDSVQSWANQAESVSTSVQALSTAEQHQRQLPDPYINAYNADNRLMTSRNQYWQDHIRQSQSQYGRANFSLPQRHTDWAAYHIGANNDGISPPCTPYQPGSMYQAHVAYQQRPIGTPLSPTAPDFNASHIQSSSWNAQTPSSPGQTYVAPLEPLNYRRLLDRNVICNWKYIVDKIVCNNDQQASIFLQQKLKIGTVDQRFEIVEAIIAQAYPLMINRFGNFLVQRCFEHGTPEQVIAIANAIRGNTLNLSMDAFGCHVVQKAFDCVPEEYKAIMVHELLRRIPETVIHRYACHVWQKLFELRWSGPPPQIMKHVNEALRGMWHEVALGETGSLVVQNIFENCLEEDKRPCINEVLANIDIVAHGQFGNWCIQHICEHGSPADRNCAIEHVLCYVTEYSMDQFASKVVEKCLKIGGPDFLERYLQRVCEGRPERPRIPLVDIASDQYGNYLIQYILTHANPQHREVVATHIRKHMVSLRGSKFGSRVGMLCCNPAFATRPGPAGSQTNRYGHFNRLGGAYR
ncbi:ARM repeat-containing protein [Xylona heveae TC161]|uniref:ARM repeat-containing protein n=1 Tax=Xylona heveae (strain CBS 132557 / TC161) TaxID=1328760 RepID=A0A165AKT4_XYLHT|nr:ARM repeat-containing protein [Xylona heveae TC161]KZF20651.1 ARM repeat-containing protein [Xylona heveae TC161]